MLMINFYALSGLLTFITSLGFGIFSWIKGAKRLNKIWAVFCFCVAIWGLGCFRFSSVEDPDAVFLWLRIGHVGVVLMPAFFLHFIFEFLGLKNIKALLFAYYLGGFFSLLNLTDFLGITSLLIAHLRFVFNQFYVDSPPAPLYPLFLCYYFGMIIYAHYFAFKSYKKADALKKSQLKYFLFATVVGFAGGATSFFMVFGLDIYPTLHITVPLYPVIMTYAIVNYRLMDIEVVIKKTVIFAGIFAMAMIVISAVSTVMQIYVGRYWTAGPNISTLVSVLLAIALYKPTRDLLVMMTDRFLFQRKSEIKHILNRLSDRVVTIIDMGQIGKTILSTLEEILRVESGMIFLQDKRAENYRMLEHFGMTADELATSVRMLLDNSSIMNYFSEHNRTMLNLDHIDKKMSLPQVVSEWLRISKIQICIPLLINDEQLALMTLGKKKSDQEYTQEEMDYFPAIASQASLAMRNACLVEAVIKEREAKLQAEHVAERVKFARTIKHEVKNSLAGSIEGPAQLLSMYHVGDLKKAFKERDEEWFLEVCDKVSGVAQKILKGVDKVHDIAETSLGGLDKKDETLRRIYFKIIWDEAKEEVLLSRDCRYESDIPDGFVVYGVYSALQRVFVNLITNACDAMNGAPRKLIKLRCDCREIDGRQAAYFEFEDNGPGIPEPVRERIFEQGFSTKPRPSSADFLASGSGQGLYACKTYIEKIHRGKLWVDNGPAGGAIFKFWIPMTGQA